MISSIVRIFILGFVGILRFSLPKLKTFADSKWTGKIAITKQTNYKDYENVYTTRAFDLELSYAEACVTIFLAMTYGFFMPIIFVTSFLQLVVLYYRDKLLSKKKEKTAFKCNQKLKFDVFRGLNVFYFSKIKLFCLF